MNKEKLQEKTFAELSEMAAKKDIPGRSSMNKDELVDALADNGSPAAATPEHSMQRETKPIGGAKTDKEPRTYESLQVKGMESGGKNPTRLYQTGPYEKTWLTKSEAEDKGFFWKDEPKENAKA